MALEPSEAEVYARYTHTCDKAFIAFVDGFITEAEFCELVTAALTVLDTSLVLLWEKEVVS